jgi:Fe-S-cluster-containing dehydrogenase component
MNRREFFVAATGGVAAAGITQLALPAGASESASGRLDEQVGVLVDTTKCIGCRKCEYACARANRPSGASVVEFNDMSVLDAPRRMTVDALTVVNRYANPADPAHPAYVKVQCMHCVRPCCVSACIVGALHRESNGSVSYDAAKCIGCRYCMLACPFEVPTYEYNNVFTPVVRKCTFCYDALQARGEPPACIQICPLNCFTFANRTELLELAHAKIEAAPDAYYNHVYGETEVGGTAWLYLTSRPATELGLIDLPETPVPQLTETLQHGIFKYGLPPLFLYGLLALTMKLSTGEEGADSPKEDGQ